MRMTVVALRRLASLVHFHDPSSSNGASAWTEEMRARLEASCSVTSDFISESEEVALLREIEPHMKRLRYEKSHWDNVSFFFPRTLQAIHLYREREQRQWSDENAKVVERIRAASFAPHSAHLSGIHILDLHQDGFIKPHIDSVRYCGDVISGVSLLSDAVMRLRHKDDSQLIVDLLLLRRSLYRLGEFGRYEFTHEVLGAAESFFKGTSVPRGRRISVICRDPPKPANKAVETLELRPLPHLP